MADWTNIPDATFDPDRPVLGSTHLAIVKNFEALAEGAVNAPRILTPAIQDDAITNAKLASPAAGTSYLIMRLQEATVSLSQANNYLDPNFHNRVSAANHLGVTCLVAGTITAYLEHRVVSGGTASTVRILKNGSQLSSWTNIGGSFVARTLNISVAVGDAIIFQHVGGQDESSVVQWRFLRIYSNNPDFAVA